LQSPFLPSGEWHVVRGRQPLACDNPRLYQFAWPDAASRPRYFAMVNASTDHHRDHPANDDERISNAGPDLAVRPLKG
jgi:hypothetical protein